MNQEQCDALATAYVAHFSHAHVWDSDMVRLKRDNSDTQWASDAVMDLTYENPEGLWDFILAALQHDPPGEVLEVLAAGPLEDYLTKCGESVIDRVEKRARSDPAFRSLLGGVWKNSMSDEVWERVQACWDRSGWDDGV